MDQPIPKSVEDRVLALIAERKPTAAMHLLEQETGMEYLDCSGWVKERIPYKEWFPDKLGPSTPCPYCGRPLKTSLAKQCLNCGMDWHNESVPVRHPVSDSRD